MRILLSYPNVRYRQGRISGVRAGVDGAFAVTFENGEAQIFDRVVTRYGPGGGARTPITTRRSRDPHAGSWLLTPLRYPGPRDKSGRSKVIEPPIDDIVDRLVSLARRRGSRRSETLNKEMYVMGLLLRPDDAGIYGDPQTWLSAQLRAGKRPRLLRNLGDR